MDPERKRRHADMRTLMDPLTEHIETASRGMADINHAEDSVYRRSVEDAALDALSAMNVARTSLYEAQRILALELSDRDVTTARIARALDVSRATILNWKAERDSPKED